MTEPSSYSGETMQVKKRGRKPKVKDKVESTYYFDTVEELAVIDYLSAKTSKEKSEIYDKFLKKPIDKMISSIMRRYKLHRKNMDFLECHQDTESFLLTKFDKFDPTKGYKAYSYFGQTCKNYLIAQNNKDKKELKRSVSYEDISSDLENRSDLAYFIENESGDPKNLIRQFLFELKEFLDVCERDNRKLNENEFKVGYALYDLFDNYEKIFVMTTNNKLNKNIILHSLREMTNMDTKAVRSSMKKFRNIYVKMLRKIFKH
jgi:hypothetical protein